MDKILTTVGRLLKALLNFIQIKILQRHPIEYGLSPVESIGPTLFAFKEIEDWMKLYISSCFGVGVDDFATSVSAKPFPIYIGWIYGDEDDRETLQALGVEGHMIWSFSENRSSLTVAARSKSGIFSHCECSGEVLNALENAYPAFWRGSFTRTDEEEYREYYCQNGWIDQR